MKSDHFSYVIYLLQLEDIKNPYRNDDNISLYYLLLLFNDRSDHGYTFIINQSNRSRCQQEGHSFWSAIRLRNKFIQIISTNQNHFYQSIAITVNPQ